jgi:hypothetical protein
MVSVTPEASEQSRGAMEWNAVLFLGAYHGINPGMGWLFAVAWGCGKAVPAGYGGHCFPSRWAIRRQ